MTKRSYVAAICGGGNSYGIVFYDFPGCTSVGDTETEVLTAGREALEGHIAVMLDFGEAVPDPTPLAKIFESGWLDELDPDGEEYWIGYSEIEVETESHGDVYVDLPRTLIRDLDRATPDARRFIIEAARRELDRLKKSA